MRRRGLVPVLLAIAALPPGCRSAGPAEEAPEPVFGAFAESFLHRPGPAPPETRYLLVAGDSSSAVFLSEVLALRDLLLRRGIPEDQVAVLYAPPNPFDPAYNLELWRALAPRTAACHLATVPAIRRSLAGMARSAGRYELLFLYFTSHGSPPLTLEVEEDPEGERSEAEALQVEFMARRQPLLDDWSLGIQRTEVMSLTREELELLALHSSGPEDLLLTPTTLGDLLDACFRDQEMVIVLSACYSGGFVLQPPHFRTRTIEGPGRVVLTSSDWDRSSFGCGETDASTYFGRCFREALETSGGFLEEMDWPGFYRKVVSQVEAAEAREGIRRPSHPRLSLKGRLLDLPGERSP